MERGVYDSSGAEDRSRPTTSYSSSCTSATDPARTHFCGAYPGTGGVHSPSSVCPRSGNSPPNPATASGLFTAGGRWCRYWRGPTPRQECRDPRTPLAAVSVATHFLARSRPWSADGSPKAKARP